MAEWHFGNATEDTHDYRGWLVGHFVRPTETLRSSPDVEIKWGIHAAGEHRTHWATDADRTTCVLLVHGQFRVQLNETPITLTHQGDYLIWGTPNRHTWEAITDSVVITVRWPSHP